MLDLTQAPPAACGHDSLRPARLAVLSHLLGKLMAAGYRLARKDRYDDFRLEWVHDSPFMVIPSVFNPKVPRTGEFLAAQIDTRLVSADAQGRDMGTGSGGCAAIAPRHARRVVAVHINMAAVRCAGINSLLNQQKHKIEVWNGDLFAPVPAERFHL